MARRTSGLPWVTDTKRGTYAKGVEAFVFARLYGDDATPVGVGTVRGAQPRVAPAGRVNSGLCGHGPVGADEQVIQLAKTELDRVGHGIQFEVIEAGVRQEDSWWRLPVLAQRHGKELPREFTVNVYANVEGELDQQHHVSVLLVPVNERNAN